MSRAKRTALLVWVATKLAIGTTMLHWYIATVQPFWQADAEFHRAYDQLWQANAEFDRAYDQRDSDGMQRALTKIRAILYSQGQP